MLNSKFSQKGSIMVEALAMLGLIAMVTPVLYRKAAERTTELQDINVASQIRMVSAAVDAYLKDNYANVGSDISAAGTVLTSGNTHYENIKGYLPVGFDLDQASKLFEDFEIAIKKSTTTDLNNVTHDVFTSAVVANLRDNMTRMRAAKIATMIGANGGIISQDGDDYKFNGTQGSWEAYGNSGFNFGWTADNHPRDNSLVSISNEAISSAVGDVDSTEALYRVAKGNDSEKNTMHTELYMDGHDIRSVTQLVAQGTNSAAAAGGAGTVTIGSEASNGNLFVRGAARIAGSLTVDDNLIVNAPLTADSATIGGVQIGPNGQVVGNVGDFVSVTGREKIIAPLVAATNITATHAGLTNVSGTTAKYTNITGRTIVATGITASGITSSGGTFNLLSATSITATNITAANAGLTNVSGDTADFNTYNGGTVDVENVYAHTGLLTYVSGTTAEFTNFIGDNVHVSSVDAHDGNFERLHAQNWFSVGGNALTDATTLRVDPGTGNIGANVNTYHVAASGAIMMDTTGEAGRSRLQAFSDYAEVSHDDQKMRVTNSGLNFNSGFSVDNSGLAIMPEGGSLAYATNYAAHAHIDPQLGDVDNANSPNVLITRNGIIELAAPTNNNHGGFIRARRLVSDVKYPYAGATGIKTPGGAVNEGGGDASQTYEFYEVNPAYTSVMNDIKLATRGGARLSDILPDYINKGIYVADNTYSDISYEWVDDSTGEAKNEPSDSDINKNDCGSNLNCVASPWLGFIRAPQCPPMYDKVITLEPFRFKMSEVYRINPDVISNYSLRDIIPTGGTNISADDFRLVAEVPATDVESWKGVTADVSVAALNSPADVKIHGGPVSIQTNTWLNTTVVPKASDSNDVATLEGWHAVMGFLYPMAQYNAIYQEITGNNYSSDHLAWNLFPVFNQENAAVARVYCSFNRVDNTGNVWGNSEVYSYDQEVHSSGYDKTSGWSNAVNDPQLGYDDAW